MLTLHMVEVRENAAPLDSTTKLLRTDVAARAESECDEDNDEDGESDPGPRDRGKRSLASMLVPIGEDCGLLHRGRLHLAKSLRVTALQTSRNA